MNRYVAASLRTCSCATSHQARSWPQLRYRGGIAEDLLDVMTKEERWGATKRNRSPRNREQLATLIERTVLDEAMRGLAK